MVTVKKTETKTGARAEVGTEQRKLKIDRGLLLFLLVENETERVKFEVNIWVNNGTYSKKVKQTNQPPNFSHFKRELKFDYLVVVYL